MEFRETKSVIENEFLGDVELGPVLGGRTILNHTQTQAHLLLKTHHTHKFYEMHTLLCREAHDKAHGKKRDTEQRNWEKMGVFSSERKAGNSPPKKQFWARCVKEGLQTRYLCLHILRRY